MKKIQLLLLSILIGLLCQAQQLRTFELAVPTDSTSYISLSQQKVFNRSQAIANKTATDFALVISTDAFGKQMEWYNLSGKDNKTPESVNGTKHGIAAISFDKDQFDQCKTKADLARMTTHITKNSFSHFSGVANSSGITQRCFIIESEKGTRGLIFITGSENGLLQIKVKLP